MHQILLLGAGQSSAYLIQYLLHYAEEKNLFLTILFQRYMESPLPIPYLENISLKGNLLISISYPHQFGDNNLSMVFC